MSHRHVMEYDGMKWKKSKRVRIRNKKEREGVQANAFGEEIHSDVWGLSPLQTIGGRRYYITFTNDHSRFTHTQLLRSKDEALQAYKDFATWAQTQRGVKINWLRSDRRGEYTSADFDRYLKEQGTERRLTTHDTPQHNGVAESLNRRLLERVRAVLHHSGLPKHLWGEVTLFATWLKNRTSTRALGNITPYERLHGQKPNLAGVPEWGQRVWVHTDTGSKLDGQAIEGRWVGYDRNSTHAHRIYWPSKNSVSVERNIRFASTTVTVYNAPLPTNKPGKTPSITAPPPPPSLPPALPPVPAPAPPQPQDIALPPSDAEDDDDEDVEDQLDPAPRGQFQPTPSTGKSKTTRQSVAGGSPGYTQATRASTRKSRPSDYKKRLEAGEGTVDGGEDDGAGPNIKKQKKKTAAAAAFTDDFADFGADCEFVAGVTPLIAEAISDMQGDPRTVNEVRSRQDWPLWQKAMDREMQTLEDAGTWETVPRPPGRNIVGSKWVFRVKRKADGSVDKYKVRLVAQGFTQVYGSDYFETYSLVAKLTTFRTILALAAQQDWDIDTFDFNGAYLNGELSEEEDIYMKNPPGYDGEEGTVKHLKKSLYGLKQAGRKWYDTLQRTLADLGFRVSEVDPGVFHTRIGDDPVIIAVHVDDCAITSSSAKALQESKRCINERHSITDLGPIHWLLGIKITQDRDVRTIALSHESYIDTITWRFNLGDAKPINTPMIPTISYSTKDAPADKTDVARMAKVPYCEAIGSLMYASVATCPDISFAVSTLSQFLENPGEAHWEAVKRVFRYLAGMRDLALTYGGDWHELTGYTDADRSSQHHR